jgi:hypothetical protein
MKHAAAARRPRPHAFRHAAALLAFGLACLAAWRPNGAAAAPGSSPNQDCATAIDMGDVSAQFTGTIDLTTSNFFPEPSCTLTAFGGGDGRDLAWKFTLPADRVVEIDTIGSPIGDTKLAIWDGCLTTEIECNDDLAPNNFLSRVRFVATGGVEYFVQVEGFEPDDIGDIVLNYAVTLIQPPSVNDTCAGAKVISELPYFDQVDMFFNTDTLDNSASVGFGGGGGTDAYWVYTPAATTTPTIAVYGYDTGFAIYTGTCGALTEVFAVDDFFGSERETFTFDAGVTYYILGEGFTDLDTGILQIAIGFPSANDQCVDATAIATLPYTNTVFNLFNTDTLDNSASVGFGGGGGLDAYWTFTPAATVSTTVSVTGFDTAFAIYTGGCGGLVEALAVDDFLGAESAMLTFNAGVTYTILAEGFLGFPFDIGDMTLVIGDAPANDICSTALALTDADLPRIESLAGATRTIDAGGNTGVELWHDFTAQMTGQYQFIADPAISGQDIVLFTYDFQDCAGFGNFAVYNSGGPGAAETTPSMFLSAGSGISIGVAGWSASDLDAFQIRFKFDPVSTGGMTFAPIDITDPAWMFLPGDGTVTNGSVGTQTGGRLELTFQAAAPTTDLAFSTGIWSRAGLAEMDFAAGMLYSARAGVAVDNLQDLGDQTRLRAQAVAGSIDHTFNINETRNEPFAPPVGTPKAYVAYFTPFDLDVNGANIVAFDSVNDGNSFGLSHTVSLHALELGSADRATFLGSPAPLVAHTTFGSWLYANYGPGVFGGLTYFEGGFSGNANGRIQHIDDSVGAGGVAEWIQYTADGLETTDGALYLAQWDLGADSGGDGTFPGCRLSPRTSNPALSIEYIIRGDSPAFDNQVGSFSTFDQIWTSQGTVNPPGAGNTEDDLLLAFGLFNIVPANSGTLDLHAARVLQIATDDPNTP